MAFVSLGADVEVFGKNNKEKHISLCGKVGGTKDKPKPMKGLPDGFMVQEDNVSLEFNIPAAPSVATFTHYINHAVTNVKGVLNNLALTISDKTSVSFHDDELTHPNALVFGCEPDYNAWTVQENQKPTCDNPNLRTAGGHVHIGTTSDMLIVVRNCDLLLGVPSVLIDDTPESIERRKLYGKAGAMRPKPYGIEYRTLSSFWIHDMAHAAWVGKAARTAGNIEEQIMHSSDEKLIVECINNGDKDIAKSLIKKYKLPLPEGFTYE